MNRAKPNTLIPKLKPIHLKGQFRPIRIDENYRKQWRWRIRVNTRMASMSSSGESFLPSLRAFFSSALAVFLSVFSLPLPAFFVFFPMLLLEAEGPSDFNGSSPSYTVVLEEEKDEEYNITPGPGPGPFGYIMEGNLQAHFIFVFLFVNLMMTTWLQNLTLILRDNE